MMAAFFFAALAALGPKQGADPNIAKVKALAVRYVQLDFSPFQRRYSDAHLFDYATTWLVYRKYERVPHFAYGQTLKSGGSYYAKLSLNDVKHLCMDLFGIAPADSFVRQKMREREDIPDSLTPKQPHGFVYLMIGDPEFFDEARNVTARVSNGTYYVDFDLWQKQDFELPKSARPLGRAVMKFIKTGGKLVLVQFMASGWKSRA